ncbi:MAG: hypothetical protein V1753_09310 [Pseudomonadota bacterium]
MPDSKAEKIKLYAVVVLAICFFVFAYFRLFYKKTPALSSQPNDAPPSDQLAVPDIGIAEANPFPEQPTGSQEPALKPVVSRDIFEPPLVIRQPKPIPTSQELEDLEDKKEKKEKIRPTFVLGGVIMDEGDPMAIINNEFVRLNDVIDGYQLVSVTENSVVLREENDRVSLDVIPAFSENK